MSTAPVDAHSLTKPMAGSWSVLLPTPCSARGCRPRAARSPTVTSAALSAQTVMQYPGPDIFHPNPEFLFAKGAGPLFDIGPYYITTLVHIFGPVATVAAVGQRAARPVPSRSESVWAPSFRSRFPPTFPASPNSRVEG